MKRARPLLRCRPGLTLLEAVVALVILSVTATAALASLGSSLRLARDAHEWEQATEIAAQAIETAKAFGPERLRMTETLPKGFARQAHVERVGAGVLRLDVMVQLPSGRSLRVARLFAERAP